MEAAGGAGERLLAERLEDRQPASELAVGPSFTPLIVIVTVAVSVPPLPSLAV